MKHLPTVIAFLFASTFLHAGQETLPPLNGSPAPQTMKELWAGFDPRAEPLDTEILKEWEEDGVVVKVLRYRIGVFKGQRAMMAAVYGYPKGGENLPALLNIHGGGQYADYQSVLTNAKRGYATISIAWAGRISSSQYRVGPAEVQLFWDGDTENKNYRITTDWGKLDAYHAPCRYPKTAFAHTSPNEWTLDPVDSPRNNPWFLITLGARRALTFLEQQPQVDPEKLGVYGHSMGAKLTVLTAANDKRVKAAAPSCGGISNFDTDNDLYNATIGDRANLRNITCPIIFLSPGNDFHGRINHLPGAVKAIGSSEWRVTCSPHHNHQDTAEYQIAGLLWMDQFLKGSYQFPESPVSKVTVGASGIPHFEVTPDRSREIVSVDIYYTQQGETSDDDRINAMHKFWRYAAPTDNGASFSADLALSSATKPLWAFANVLYRLQPPQTGAGYYYGVYTADTVNLSSLVEMIPPDHFTATLEPSLLIEDFTGDWRKNWFTYKPEEWGIRTNKIYSPLYKAPAGAKLAIEIRSAEPNKLVMGIDDFAAELSIKGGSEWESFSLAPADFKTAGEETLPDFTHIKQLRLLAAEHLRGKRGTNIRKLIGANWKGAAPEFKNLHWEK